MTGRVFSLSARRQPNDGIVADRVHRRDREPGDPKRRFIVFVHGFNNDQKTANHSYKTFRANLKKALGHTVRPESNGLPDVGFFHWPGDSTSFVERYLESWRVYPRSIKNARESAQRLAIYLKRLAERADLDVYLVGHSMGCRLILELLARPESGQLGFPPVRLAALMAAAVPVALVGPWGYLGGAARRAGLQALIFHSSYDMVLGFAFPPGQFLAFKLGIETAVYRRALGLDGAPGLPATQQPMVGYGHSYYWPSWSVAQDVAKSLGAAAPHTAPVRRLCRAAQIRVHIPPKRQPSFLEAQD